MRGPRLIHLRVPSRTATRKNGKALSLAENDDVDALKVGSVKDCKSLLERPMVIALAAAFDAEAFTGTELLKSCLAGGNRIINLCRQTNRKFQG